MKSLGRILIGLAVYVSCSVAMPVTQSMASKTTECFSSPGECGFPDPAFGNVGVPSGSKLTEIVGTVTASSEGATIQDYDVLGYIKVTANKVTIKDSRIANTTGNSCGTEIPCGNSDILIAKGITGTVLESDELTVEPKTRVEWAVENLGSKTVAQKVYTHGTDDSWNGPGTIENSYFLASDSISREHVENIYDPSVEATEKILVHHDTLLDPFEQTANVFLESDKGYKGESAITQNLMAGSAYSVWAGYRPLIFKENRFARCKETEKKEVGGWACEGGADSHGYYPRGGYSGLCVFFEDSFTTQSANVWDDNNESIGNC